MMSLSYTINLCIALLLTVVAGFVAIPAGRLLIRNIYLTRKGSLAPGRYLGSHQVAFLADGKRQITFATWGKASALAGKKFEVLYDPQRPGQAEVRNSGALWFKPVDKLALAIGQLAGVVGLIFNMNYVLAACLFVGCTILLQILVRIILAILVLLSAKYRRFSRLGRHILADYPIQTAEERCAEP